jgi:predicted lipase
VTATLTGGYWDHLNSISGLYTEKNQLMAGSSQHPDKENAAADEMTPPKYGTAQKVDMWATRVENEFVDSAQDGRFNDMEIERAMKHSDHTIGKVQEIQKEKRAYWTLMAGVVGVAATFSVVTGVIKLWKWIHRTRKVKQVQDKPTESTDVKQSEDKGRKTRRHARGWDQYH